MIDNATICAIATPPGNGAISILRLSGKDTYAIAAKLVAFPSGGKNIDQLPANSIHFTRIVSGEETIDEVLISLFRAPHSYTGEDLIEISCHGAVFIQQRILELLIGAGARIAEPGEFTMRAFLNGKMDLSQAEAVADLIASSSEASHRVAINQMRGGFSSELARLREQLLNFISLIELELDFSEEDVEFADRNDLQELVSKISGLILVLKNSFQMGNVIKNGVPVAITGKTNVGKSTLLNALLHDERAIVSEIAGTTRDVIEDVITMDGLSFRFIDTAGLRNTSDTIESIGIGKTFEKIKQAYIVLYVIDATQEIKEIDRLIGKIKIRISRIGSEGQAVEESGSRGSKSKGINQSSQPGKNVRNHKLVILFNKIDFLSEKQLAALSDPSKFNNMEAEDNVLQISASYGENIDTLASLLLELVRGDQKGGDDVIITNARHFEALSHAGEAIERVAEGLKSGLSSDLVAQDIRQVLHYLGEITGEVTTDEILGNIFSKFCIGK